MHQRRAAKPKSLRKSLDAPAQPFLLPAVIKSKLISHASHFHLSVSS